MEKEEREEQKKTRPKCVMGNHGAALHFQFSRSNNID